jgi:predicted DNA-binding WGR domain protein
VPTNTRRFEFRDQAANTDKFWEVTVTDNLLTRRWGRRGTEGQARTDPFISERYAEAEAGALIRSKMREGYIEVTEQQQRAATLFDNVRNRVATTVKRATTVVKRRVTRTKKVTPAKDSQSLDVSERSIDL